MPYQAVISAGSRHRLGKREPVDLFARDFQIQARLQNAVFEVEQSSNGASGHEVTIGRYIPLSKVTGYAALVRGIRGC